MRVAGFEVKTEDITEELNIKHKVNNIVMKHLKFVHTRLENTPIFIVRRPI